MTIEEVLQKNYMILLVKKLTKELLILQWGITRSAIF